MSTLKVNTITPVSGDTVNVDGDLTVGGSPVSGFPFTGSAAISGSFLVTGSSTLAVRISGSTALTGSLFVSGTVSGSFIGDGSSLTGISGYTVANSSNNRVITSVDATNANAEANLTFDGTKLGVTGNVSASAGFSGSFQGDGSALTGVGGFPHTGSADITGSLIVTGSAFVTTLTETSALRYKKYVKGLPTQTDTVYQLRPVHFRWKNNNKKDYGLIAEEVQKIYPELVTSGENGDALGISYTKLTALLVKTIQELTDRVSNLENKLN